MLRAIGIALLAAAIMLGASAGAGAQNPQTAAAMPAEPYPLLSRLGRVDWNGDNFFGPCRGDCSIAGFAGKEITTGMTRIFLVKYPMVPAWEWRWRDSGIVAGAFSRRLVTFWDAWDIELEIGAAKRFGLLQAGEFWGSAVIRWTAFPWNDYVKTTIALSQGISLATQVESRERALNRHRRTATGFTKSGSILLNYFSPEVTFALPRYPDHELMFRFAHRSGIFGTINDVHAGTQYGTIGLRVRF
jgi:hypothetical protein